VITEPALVTSRRRPNSADVSARFWLRITFCATMSVVTRSRIVRSTPPVTGRVPICTTSAVRAR